MHVPNFFLLLLDDVIGLDISKSGFFFWGNPQPHEFSSLFWAVIMLKEIVAITRLLQIRQKIVLQKIHMLFICHLSEDFNKRPDTCSRKCSSQHNMSSVLLHFRNNTPRIMYFVFKDVDIVSVTKKVKYIYIWGTSIFFHSLYILSFRISANGNKTLFLFLNLSLIFLKANHLHFDKLEYYLSFLTQ